MIMLYLTGAVLFAAGAGLALLGFRFGGRNKQFNARAVATQGVVVGNREHYSTSSSIARRIYFPLVRYTTPTGQTLETSGPGQDAPLAEGTQLPLLFDPQEPGEVSFTGPRGSAGIASSLGIMGVVLALLAIAMIVGTTVVMVL